MSRQDKATTEKHTRILRELVKRPENRVCADCKHNDPRWATWNIGAFLCIRCSGIHRSMGTHISKVKSIDLDTWTPEQMESILKWGNRRANLYWEAHLKPGHIPPDHKIESFIRSKYESRRWARDGPPPSDPSVLEDDTPTETPAEAPPAPIAQHSTTRSTHALTSSLSAPRPASPATRTHVTARQPQPHQLLSAQHIRGQSAAQSVPSPAAASQPVQQPTPVLQVKASENDLFSLDFHAPTPSGSIHNATAEMPKKDVKQDILSLFATPSQQSQAAFGGLPPTAAVQQSPWAQPSNSSTQHQSPAAPVPQQQLGGAWGVGFGWNAQAPAATTSGQSNVWGASAPAAQPASSQQAMFNTNDIWGSTANTTGSAGGDLFGSVASSNIAQKKDDVFGDIWGGFK
ncbi:ArfGap-domain-containing protein [Dentipellis sp. KUC8613]|nr:ArfGap-domain-containing protein [Dentipellis sp. KUC8613]